jgi:hypothetical protein
MKPIVGYVVVASALSTLSLGFMPLENKTPLAAKVHMSKDKRPLDSNYACFELTNTSDKPIELYSNSNAGIFFDFEVVDASNTRISKEFHRRSVSSIVSVRPELMATIEPGKSLKCEMSLLSASGVDRAKLKPGKYKCRIRFEYKDLKVSSEQFEIEITQADIDTIGKE